MSSPPPSPPLVALFAAADPTCGAGIFADVRAVAAQSCAPVAVTCGVAAQNLQGVAAVQSLSAKDIRAQFAAVRRARFAAIKVGALFSPAAARAVAECLDEAPGVPVVWDPVLAPSRGARFADSATRDAVKKLLAPRATVVTPNRREAAALAGVRAPAGPAAAAGRLIALGAKNVLITDSERRRAGCVLYCGENAAPTWRADDERIPGDYHGTGCFFAATLAARIARGDSIPAAARRAHAETLAAIGRAVAVAALGGQKLIAPRR